MKKTKSIFHLLLLVFLLSSCSSPLIEQIYEQLVKPDRRMELAKYEANLVEKFHRDLDNFADASVYTIELEIGEIPCNVDGRLEVLYANTESVQLNEIYFRLFPNVGNDHLSVENVMVEDQTVDFTMEYEGTAVRIALAEPLIPDESLTISMDFYQTVPSVMGGNYGLYIYLDEILALDSFFPIIPVYSDEGWNVEDPPRNADMIFTDASFFEVRVTAPEELVLAASGVKSSVEELDGLKVTTFLAGPQRDFYIAASPRFVSESRMVGGTLVRSYFPPEYRENGLLVLETAATALELFSEKLGEYPNTELDLVSTPMQAGGMEYSGAAAMAFLLYKSDATLGGLPGSNFLESATAHEVAHQWFFNLVMNDQIDEPWLDEGFAQYMTYLYYLGAYGGSASESYQDSWRGRWSRTNFAEIPIGLPADAYQPQEYSAIIYGRAPIFINELEDMMGEEIFDEFLRQYIDKYRWEEVDTRDFLILAEETCSCELDALFEEYGAIQ